jgi:hypothetical protein
MTIKSSGAISFTDIVNEFGDAGTKSISNYYGLDAGIPNSGAIKFSDFYGKVINARRTIGASTNYNARSDLSNASIIGAYKSIATVVSNNLPVKLYITVNGLISASNTSTTAFDTGNFPAGSSIYLTNNNYIAGAGGNGGNANSGGGGNGGPALTLRLTTYITNNGTIGGGGGGGGAGGGGCFTQCQQVGCCEQRCYEACADGGGGGGGAGSAAGSGGSGANGGATGDLTTGGSGGGGGYSRNGPASASGSSGANGGNLGQNGGDSSGGGGSAGNYIVNNGFATWLVTGSRLGGVG